MSTARSIFREYAKSKGKEAKEFVRIEDGIYDQNTLHTKGAKGNHEELLFNHRDIFYWVLANYKLEPKKGLDYKKLAGDFKKIMEGMSKEEIQNWLEEDKKRLDTLNKER